MVQSLEDNIAQLNFVLLTLDVEVHLLTPALAHCVYCLARVTARPCSDDKKNCHQKIIYYSKILKNSTDIPIDTLQNEALVRLDDTLARVVSDSEALQENKGDEILSSI